MTNPLLADESLPQFSKIRAEHVIPAVKKSIAECKATVERVVNQNETYTWENLIQPIDESNEKLNNVWSPVSHLNAVKNSESLRKAYEEAISLLSEYGTWIGQHTGLFQAYKQLKKSSTYKTLTKAQKKSIDLALRDFTLSGIDLSAEKKKRYGEIVTQLSGLSSKFSNNVLDSTMAWSKLITDKSQLNGLPDNAKHAAKVAAESKGQSGWLLTLEMPCYHSVITYCDNPDLRHEIYKAHSTRASETGPQAGKWDNTEVIKTILALRHELAQLLGFSTYADKSLATKMADDPQKIIDFLLNLAARAKPHAKKELAELTMFAKQHYDVLELMPWDIPYYSEKQKQHRYAVSDEALRPYFPEEKVLNGLFEVIHRIFGITIKERHDVDVWHEQVHFYDIHDKNQRIQGSFYLDLYAREHKRGGAWMDDCKSRMRLADGTIQHPVAYLTCNFNKPIGDKPALFTHDEVTTLFHEFGHGLHHMLTNVEISSVSGINGVPWDAVEFPSQFLENWCWQPEALSFISSHYETGESLPATMLDKLLAIKNYQAALFILRQLEFALFDFQLHYDYSGDQAIPVMVILDQIRRQIAVIPSVSWSRFPQSFSHIFAGGYAAGYYSYLWAQVLAADAFSRFEKEGIFNSKTGNDFLHHILSQGGSDEPMTLFKNFRGREPVPDALLHYYGIATNPESA